MTVAYFNGEFQQLEEIRISPLHRGFLFADGVAVGKGAPGPLWERVHGLFQDYKQRLMRGDLD